MVGTELLDGFEFRWGEMKGKGGRKKDVQFYGSFTYDGEEYFLYDSVYLYKEDEPEPYIGKLIKIWENGGKSKSKKVKILWFFRPCEISNFLGVDGASENELFLASGEGVGLCNINPLGAIAGKCNVVCISKDSRNPQPTVEELQKADYVFYRTFDVGSLKVVDKIEEKISGTDVKLLLNKMDIRKDGGTLKVDLGGNEVSENAVQNDASHAIVGRSDQSLPKDCAAVKTNGYRVDISANDAADSDVPLIKRKSLPAEKTASSICVTSGDLAKPNQTEENVSGHKALLRSKVESDSSEGKDGKVLVRQVECEEKDKSAFVELDDRPSKKAKLSSEYPDRIKNSMHQPRLNSDLNDKDVVAPSVSVADDKNEVKPCKGSTGTDVGPSKKRKPCDKAAVLSNDKLLKASSRQCHNEDRKSDGHGLEVTPRPDADRRKWFKELPWDDRMRDAYKQGTLVLLQNLDPSYASVEVEDIIFHGFGEHCKAKMIQRTVFSSPHSGQAFVIFKKKDVAEMVVRKLNEGCLLLSNGRPLVGSLGTHCFPEQKPTFFGHLVIDRLRHHMQREQRDAISTSHCSQPNTYEFDMAMNWRLLQERSDFLWEKLYEKQGQELKKLKTKLKAR